MASSNQTPDVLFSPIAANADASDINTIPQTYDPANYGYAAQNVGFPTECRLPVLNPDGTLGQGRAPRMQDWNGIMKLVSSHNFFLQNGGSYTFNPTVSSNIGGYPKNAILWYFPENEAPCLVYSLINDNTNNFVDDPTLIDGTHWEKLSFGGGARNVGEIVPSTIPLSDAGLHLADGSLISGSGSYADFVTYMAGLVSTHPDLFDTEANWQSSVSTYGVCGKYVYDSANNTIRLPKLSGFVEGTLDPTKLGDLVEAGLPNIEAWANFYGQVLDSAGGSFTRTVGNSSSDPTYSSSNTFKRLDLDASRSSSIYGNSTTVQPQSIKVFFYIVIATSTKTDIQVDIDEIAADLNGKADIDASNFNASGKSLLSGLGMPSGNYIDLTLGASGSTYTAPANGYFILSGVATAADAYVYFVGAGMNPRFYSPYSGGTASGFCPAKKGQSFRIDYNNINASASLTSFRFGYAEGEN